MILCLISVFKWSNTFQFLYNYLNLIRASMVLQVFLFIYKTLNILFLRMFSDQAFLQTNSRLVLLIQKNIYKLNTTIKFFIHKASMDSVNFTKAIRVCILKFFIIIQAKVMPHLPLILAYSNPRRTFYYR